VVRARSPGRGRPVSHAGRRHRRRGPPEGDRRGAATEERETPFGGALALEALLRSDPRQSYFFQFHVEAGLTVVDVSTVTPRAFDGPDLPVRPVELQPHE
jgi:hypothetical protein